MREIKKTEREKSNQLKKSPSDLDRQGTGDLKGGKKKLPVPKAKTISGSASSSKTKWISPSPYVLCHSCISHIFDRLHATFRTNDVTKK